jgi:hypothetical protein
MKLNYFSSQTVPKGYFGNSSKTARVAFNKAGTITFNPLAQKALGLKQGTKLTLAQDEDNPRDWYFFKDDENGFELSMSSDQKYLKFGHSKLISALFEAFGFEKGTRAFDFDKVPTVMKGSKTEYWKIITTD